MSCNLLYLPDAETSTLAGQFLEPSSSVSWNGRRIEQCPIWQEQEKVLCSEKIYDNPPHRSIALVAKWTENSSD
jgi:hypothetical protein